MVVLPCLGESPRLTGQKFVNSSFYQRNVTEELLRLSTHMSTMCLLAGYFLIFKIVWQVCMFICQLQGVQEKKCFFHNSLQPLPSPTSLEETFKTLSTQCECTVTPIG